MIGRETFQDMVRACNITGMTPFVKLPDNSPDTILGYLDAGALGIIVTDVRTADDALAAVSAARYAPQGTRGAGSTTRVANYGLTQTPAEYFRRANEEMMVVALIESGEGIENLDAILAVDGLDAVRIGAGDLAMSLGLPGEAGHPRVKEMVRDAEARVAASNKVLLTVARDAAAARAAASAGAGLIAVNVGVMLRDAARGFLDGVAE
jgi:2-keto-3-deoxy-L-rhamnonate aldolase RhmA